MRDNNIFINNSQLHSKLTRDIIYYLIENSTLPAQFCFLILPGNVRTIFRGVSEQTSIPLDIEIPVTYVTFIQF